MELYVRSGEPHHRDMAARCVQHNAGLQQQSAALRQRLHGPVRPAAAGRRTLRGHCYRDGRKQQGHRVCPESERGAVRGSSVFVRLCFSSGLCGRPPHAAHVAAGQGVQKDRGMETQETDARN